MVENNGNNATGVRDNVILAPNLQPNWVSGSFFLAGLGNGNTM